jgi:hypothetical protein
VSYEVKATPAPFPARTESEDSLPLVSVIICTYNRCDVLPHALDSVLAQSYRPLEIIVVDDASTDETDSVLSQYHSRGEIRISRIRNSQNLGLQKTLNRALDAASGRYFARIDDDDLWTDEDKISHQVAALEKDSRLAAVGTAYIDENGAQITNPVSDGKIRKQMLFRCPFCHSTMVVRSESAHRLGGYDETLPYAEDWDLWCRLGRDFRLANLPDVTVRRGQPGETMSSTYQVEKLHLASMLARKYRDDYPGWHLARLYHATSAALLGSRLRGSVFHRVASRIFRIVFTPQ